MSTTIIKPTNFVVIFILCVVPVLLLNLAPASYDGAVALIALTVLYLGQVYLLLHPLSGSRRCSVHPGFALLLGVLLLATSLAGTWLVRGVLTTTADPAVLTPAENLVSLVYLPVIVLSAIREELVYRVWMYEAISPHLGEISTVVLQGLVFSLMHGGSGPVGMIVALMAGLILGLAYMKRHSASEIVIAHVLYNIVVYYGVGRI